MAAHHNRKVKIMEPTSDENHGCNITNAIYFYSNQQYALIVKNYLEQNDVRINIQLERGIMEDGKRETIKDFDCVISDYHLLETTGINLLRSIRIEYPNVPFILLDDQGNMKRGLDAIGAGATSYLEKGNGKSTLEEIESNIKLGHSRNNKK